MCVPAVIPPGLTLDEAIRTIQLVGAGRSMRLAPTTKALGDEAESMEVVRESAAAPVVAVIASAFGQMKEHALAQLGTATKKLADEAPDPSDFILSETWSEMVSGPLMDALGDALESGYVVGSVRVTGITPGAYTSSASAQADAE